MLHLPRPQLVHGTFQFNTRRTQNSFTVQFYPRRGTPLPDQGVRLFRLKLHLHQRQVTTLSGRQRHSSPRRLPRGCYTNGKDIGAFHPTRRVCHGKHAFNRRLTKGTISLVSCGTSVQTIGFSFYCVLYQDVKRHNVGQGTLQFVFFGVLNGVFTLRGQRSRRTTREDAGYFQVVGVATVIGRDAICSRDLNNSCSYTRVYKVLGLVGDGVFFTQLGYTFQTTRFTGNRRTL